MDKVQLENRHTAFPSFKDFKNNFQKAALLTSDDEVFKPAPVKKEIFSLPPPSQE